MVCIGDDQTYTNGKNRRIARSDGHIIDFEW
jgi:hypothetical protein